jgi:TolB protein
MREIKLILSALLLFWTGCQSVSNSKGSQKTDVGQVYGQDRIAFSRLTDGYWQVWTSGFDGSQAKQLTFSAIDKRRPIWCPSDQALYFRDNNRQIYRIAIDSGESEQRVFSELGSIEDLVFSKDGSTMAMVGFRNQYRDSANIRVADSGAKNYRVLTWQSSLQYNPAISSDGKTVAYIASNGHHHTDELHIIDIESGSDVQLTSNDYQEIFPSFSPDGQRIVYSSDITGDYEIWVMNRDGSQKKQITFSPGLDTHPVFSPDGKRILFTSNQGGQLHLCMMNDEGTNIVRIHNEAPCIDPAWKGK